MIALVHAMVDEDARITIEDIAQALDISSGGVWNIFEDKPRCSKVSAMSISHILTEKKRDRVSYSKSFP